MPPVVTVPPEPKKKVTTTGGITIFPPTHTRPTWRLDYTEDGKRHPPSAGRTWAQAAAKIAVIETRLTAGTGSKPTFSAKAWLGWWLSPGRQPRTSKGVERQAWGDNHRFNNDDLVRRFVGPAVGDTPCELIDTAMLQRAIDLAVREATPNVAGRVLTVIRTAVREGFQDGWFVQHPDALVGRLTAPIQPARRRQGLNRPGVSGDFLV